MKTEQLEKNSIVLVDYEEYSVLIGHEELQSEVQRIAERITRDYKGKNPIILGIAMGGLLFWSDVCKYLEELDFNFESDIMRFSRYSDKNEANEKNIYMLYEPKLSLEGRYVIIVDDVYEEGITVDEARKYSIGNRAMSIELCLACVKNKYMQRFPIKYSILSGLSKEWLVGYGMNSGKVGRFLPFIAQKIK